MQGRLSMTSQRIVFSFPIFVFLKKKTKKIKFAETSKNREILGSEISKIFAGWSSNPIPMYGQMPCRKQDISTFHIFTNSAPLYSVERW